MEKAIWCKKGDIIKKLFFVKTWIKKLETLIFGDIWSRYWENIGIKQCFFW